MEYTLTISALKSMRSQVEVNPGTILQYALTIQTQLFLFCLQAVPSMYYALEPKSLPGDSAF